MTSLFDAAAVDEIVRRIESVGPHSVRQWGTMNAAQAMAHCAVAMEFGVGDRTAPRMLIGRLIGGFIKPLALGARSMKRGTPTAPSLVVNDERELEVEKARLVSLVRRFAAAGPSGVTRAPHTFFGHMTPDEWARLGYKHLDHHLKQFGA